MAVKVIDLPIKEFHAQELAPQSNSNLIANRRSVNVRGGFKEILLNAVAACRVALVPRISGVYWYDDSADVWNDLLGPSGPTGQPAAILDSARTGTPTFTLAVADFLYIGAVGRFGGAVFDLDGNTLNTQASTLTCAHSSTGFNNWPAITITNGTDSSGTFAQDGNITFTVAATPAEGVWVARDLGDITGIASAPVDSKAYWLRFDTSALLELVGIDQLSVLSHNMAAAIATAGAGFHAKAGVEYTIDLDSDVGALDHIAQAGGATTIQLAWIRR